MNKTHFVIDGETAINRNQAEKAYEIVYETRLVVGTNYFISLRKVSDYESVR